MNHRLDLGSPAPDFTLPDATGTQTHAHDMLVPASTAADLMGCVVQTVYRNLSPAVQFPNGQKLYRAADALAWKRRRKAPTKPRGFQSRECCRCCEAAQERGDLDHPLSDQCPNPCDTCQGGESA